jgi:hypothetical protein
MSIPDRSDAKVRSTNLWSQVVKVQMAVLLNQVFILVRDPSQRSMGLQLVALPNPWIQRLLIVSFLVAAIRGDNLLRNFNCLCLLKLE